MITLQPSIAITPNFTEERTNEAHLKLEKVTDTPKVTDTSRSCRLVVLCEKQIFTKSTEKKPVLESLF